MKDHGLIVCWCIKFEIVRMKDAKLRKYFTKSTNHAITVGKIISVKSETKWED